MNKKHLLIVIIALGINILHAKDNYANIELIRERYALPALGGAQITKGHTSNLAVSGIRKIGNPTQVQVNDKWHIGSLTKSMTATLTAILIEKKVLNITWQTTMEDIFGKDFYVHYDFKKSTLEMIFAHRSGIAEDISSINKGKLWNKLWETNLSPTYGRALTAETILSQSRSHQHNEGLKYSNAGYIIIGAILENQTGHSWEYLMKEHLFKPLKMGTCGFGIPDVSNNSNPRHPWGHRLKKGKLTAFNSDNPKTLGPAGTVHCSINDLLKYIKIHIRGFNGHNTEVLKASNFKKLHTDYKSQSYTAGGWGLINKTWSKKPVLTHIGSNSLNVAKVYIAPSLQTGLIAVTNYGNSENPLEAIEELLKSFIFKN